MSVLLFSVAKKTGDQISEEKIFLDIYENNKPTVEHNHETYKAIPKFYFRVRAHIIYFLFLSTTTSARLLMFFSLYLFLATK